MCLKKIILLFSIFIIGAPVCYCQQFTYPWNFQDSAVGIQDLHFMPGDSEFIYTSTGNFIRIRKTMTAEIVRQYPGVQGLFGFTPDSQEIVTVMDKKIELRNLSDMSLIRSDSLQLGADTIDQKSNLRFHIRFLAMAVDPIRPFVYTIVQKSNDIADDRRIDSVWVVVYNFNTMKQIKVLNPEGFNTHYYLAHLAVSKDGKYLASLNDGATYLKVWDIPTLTHITSVPLYDVNNYNQHPGEYWCYPEDIKFSEINSDIIYYSGRFKKISGIYLGLVKYNFQTDTYIDTTIRKIGSGVFVIFDHEERVMYATYEKKYVFNLSQHEQEHISEMHFPEPGTWGINPVYSKKYDIFIGYNGEYCSSGIYDRGTSVESELLVQGNLFPNPTNGNVTIQTDCILPEIGYRITRPNGETIANSSAENLNNSLQIDFSAYQNGVYFITLACGASGSTYKVVNNR